MLSIQKCELPEHALLHSYVEKLSYVDCYTTVVAGSISHSEYVMAFYTTWLFKLERLILKWFIDKTSSDQLAEKMARGEINTFAAWHVESRAENQLLMCDFKHRTRSWFMLEALAINDKTHTRLYFGSAVVPLKTSKPNQAKFGKLFYLLITLHKAYSILLLYYAKNRLLTACK